MRLINFETPCIMSVSYDYLFSFHSVAPLFHALSTTLMLSTVHMLLILDIMSVVGFGAGVDVPGNLSSILILFFLYIVTYYIVVFRTATHVQNIVTYYSQLACCTGYGGSNCTCK